MLNLFYDPKTQNYFFIDKVNCCSCKQKINNLIIIQTIWRRKDTEVNYFCAPCSNQIKKDRSIVDSLSLAIVDTPPNTAYPVLPRVPDLINFNGETVTSIATKDDDAKIKNNCKVAFDPNHNIMPEYKINKIAFKEREKELNKKLTKDTEVKEYLTFLSTSIPAIDYNEVKRIEVKR